MKNTTHLYYNSIIGIALPMGNVNKNKHKNYRPRTIE